GSGGADRRLTAPILPNPGVGTAAMAGRRQVSRRIRYMEATAQPGERPLLQVVIASVREERKGALVADWFIGEAEKHGGFDVERIDLAEVDLPLFDEPRHPRLRQYEHEHTKAWSRSVTSAD